MKNKKFHSMLILPLILTLSACGGGSSSTDTTTISGKVIDGYIEKATVCIDTNQNLECDASEPFAETDVNGNYSIDYAGDTTGLHVLAKVTEYSTDADLGRITKPYSLLAPASSADTVTPYSTLVSNNMMVYKTSVEEEEVSVRTFLNLDPDAKVLNHDFVNDEKALQLAQIVVSALSTANYELETNPKTSSITDKDRIISVNELFMNHIKAKVVSSRGEVFTEVSDALDAEESSQAGVAKALKDVGIEGVVEGNIDPILSRIASGESNVINIKDAFKDGLIIVNEDENLEVNYMTFNEGDVNQVKENRYELVESSGVYSWEKDTITPYDKIEYRSETDEWVVRKDQTISDASYDDNNINCVSLSDTGKNNPGADIWCGLEKDLSSKKLTTFIPGLCDEDAADTCKDSTFPPGARAYDLTYSMPVDLYEIYTDGWEGFTTNIKNFLTVGFERETSDILFKIASIKKNNANEVESGVIEWKECKPDCGDESREFSPIETTTFDVITLDGKQVVRTLLPDVYLKRNPSAIDQYIIFAEAPRAEDNSIGVYSGDFKVAGRKVLMPFTGDPYQYTQVINKIAWDEIAKQKEFPEYPYPE